MPKIIQPSFARGELGDDLWGRVDTGAYAVSLRTALNVVIHAYGGASNRAGLMFVGPCATHSGTPPRLIEFKFNTEDTYILEFGELYMRVIRNDAHVLESAKTITGATAADPVVVTAASHGYSNGDDVYIIGVVGMTQLNARWFTVANKTANTFELTSQQTGVDIDGTGYTAYSSAGTVSKVFELVTPYALADVLTLKFIQSANVMTLVHPSYPVQLLTRTGHAAWTIVEETFLPLQPAPDAMGVTVNTTGSETVRYSTTAISHETGEESLAAAGVAKFISGATQTDPVVVTATAHNFHEGEQVLIELVGGMIELNDRYFHAINVTANTFELEGEDGTGHTAFTAGGTASGLFFEVTNSAVTRDNTPNWTKASGRVRHYSVYRWEGGVYGWIGDTTETSFDDKDIVPSFDIRPPDFRQPFVGIDNFPRAVGYYAQRKVFGSTNNDPDTIWYSVTGSQANLTYSTPLKADDAITSILNSSEVNEIRSFTAGNDLLVFTSGSEWRINAGVDSAFSTETQKLRPQSYWGCNELTPIAVGDKTLFVTENDAIVRSIGYEIAVDGYRGGNMTVFAPHLFKNNSTVAWAFSRSPDPVVYVVRDDGFVCSLTFDSEQEVVAWSRWNTDGKFLDVATTRPSSTDVDQAGYFIVQRTIGGSSAYYIERVASRRFTDVRDCFFVDSGLSLDSPITITGATAADPVVITAASHGFSDGDEVDIHDIKWTPDVDDHFNYTQPDQLNGRRYFVAEKTTNTFELVTIEGRVDITGATQADPVVITSVAHGFSDSDVIGVFNVAGMVELNGNTYKVSNKTSDTFELTDLADVDIDGSAFTAYTSGGQMYPGEDGSDFNAYVEDGTVREAFSNIGGIWHLEGREVVILADGNVIEGLTVIDGGVTLPRKFSRVHLGLRYVTDIETLDPEAPRGTIQGGDIRVPFVTLRVKETRGLLIGPNSSDLTEWKQRSSEVYGEPTRLLTGDKEVNIYSDWRGGGRVFIRQIYPLPLTLTATIPFLDVGDQDEEE